MDKPDEGGGTPADQEHPLLTAPVVFQCARCRQIVGDTLDLVATNGETKDVSLRHACGVIVATHPLHLVPSSDASDQAAVGSSFVLINCAACGAKLGRVYRSTTPALDPIRNCYTFSADAMRSFLLGSAQRVASSAGRQQGTVGGVAEAVAQGRGGADDLNAIQDELTQMQGLFLVFDSRCGDLEHVTKEMTTRMDDLEHRLRTADRDAEGGSTSSPNRAETTRGKRRSPWQ